jgi:3-deoxy-D-manno-octulosonic-acid transferase
LQRVFEWAWLSLYTLLGLMVYAMYAPWVLLRHTVAGHARAALSNGFLLRLGLIPGAIAKVESPVWFHAVSVGEMLTIVPLIRAFRSKHPGIPVLVTTVTEAGQRAAIQALEGTGCTVAYFPLDVLPVVSRVISRVNPRLFAFSENEIWPAFLFVLEKRGVPAVMVNGRVSDRSLRRFSWVPLFRHALKRVSVFSLQSRKDYDKLVGFGIDPSRLRFFGNLKVDRVLLAAGQLLTPPEVLTLTACKAKKGGLWVVGGSTHKGEEEALLSAFEALLDAGVQATLLLAPRHLERLASIESLLKEKRARYTRLGAIGDKKRFDEDIVLIDRMGTLFSAYRLADVAFVGGSLVPKGGHNILEPLVLGVPVLFGEHTENIGELAQGVLGLGLGKRLKDALALEEELLSLARRPESLKEAASRCRAFILEHKGALEATAELLFELVHEADGARIKPGSSLDVR